MKRVRAKRSKEVVYFRFFSNYEPESFYYTRTEEAVGFEVGQKDDFEPIGTTWEKIQYDN